MGNCCKAGGCCSRDFLEYPNFYHRKLFIVCGILLFLIGALLAITPWFTVVWVETPVFYLNAPFYCIFNCVLGSFCMFVAILSWSTVTIGVLRATTAFTVMACIVAPFAIWFSAETVILMYSITDCYQDWDRCYCSNFDGDLEGDVHWYTYGGAETCNERVNTAKTYGLPVLIVGGVAVLLLSILMFFLVRAQIKTAKQGSDTPDVFLIHDEDSADRVKQINSMLLALGVNSWNCDVEGAANAMDGNRVTQLFDRIDRSRCAVVFLSQNLNQEVTDFSGFSQTQVALEYAIRVLGAERVLPVVLESVFMNTSAWPACMEELKAGHYVDLTSREDTVTMSQCQKVKHLLGRIPKKYDDVTQKNALKSIAGITAKPKADVKYVGSSSVVVPMNAGMTGSSVVVPLNAGMTAVSYPTAPVVNEGTMFV